MPDDEVAAAMAKVRGQLAELGKGFSAHWAEPALSALGADIRRLVEARDKSKGLNEDATKGMAILNGEILRLREQLRVVETERDEALKDLTDVQKVEAGLVALHDDVATLELINELSAAKQAAETKVANLEAEIAKVRAEDLAIVSDYGGNVSLNLQLEAAEADAARLAEALKFYAIRERYFHENEACPEICEDEGTKARAALAAHAARVAAAKEGTA